MRRRESVGPARRGQRGLKEMTVAILAGWFLITPTMASDNWKAEAERWKAHAKKWEAIAKSYEARYGWINDGFGWCSMNKGVSIISGYTGPYCYKPSEPFCVITKNCSEWEIGRYKFDVETWINCRKDYIRQAQDDAGCALQKIRQGIDQAIEGE